MSKITRIIAILLVVQWALSISTILLFILLGMFNTNDGIDLLKSYSSISSGFVGIIVGYLFHSRKDEK